MTLERSDPVFGSRRIAPLDGLRGVAALLVVAYHYLFVQVYVEVGATLYYLKAPLKFAWSGVDLFFVLSGFLITTILIRAKDSPNYFATFYARRISRIFPLYFLVLGLFLLARLWLPSTNALTAHPAPLWTYPLFVQNIAFWLAGSSGAQWLTPTWSLAVEEQFYLFVPLIVLWLRPRPAVAVLAALTIMAPVLRHLYPSSTAFMMTPFRTDSLLVGSLLAYGMQNARFVSLCRDHIRTLHLVLAILTLGVPVMMLRRQWFEPLDFTWLSALYAMLILIVQISPNGRLATLLSGRILLWFGATSYAIYMFHEAILGLCHYLVSGYDQAVIANTTDLAVTGLAFAVTCGLAALSGRYLEGPARRFGHRWKY